MIPAGQWVRYELIIEWLSDHEFRWYPRLYDMDNNLLSDVDDFHWGNNPFTTLADYQNEGGIYWRNPEAVAENPAESIRTASFGRGQAGDQSPGHFYAAAAAYGVRTGPDDFIGPFVAGEGE